MHAPQILQIQEKRCKDSTQYNQGETNLDTKKLSFTNAEQHKKKKTAIIQTAFKIYISMEGIILLNLNITVNLLAQELKTNGDLK